MKRQHFLCVSMYRNIISAMFCFVIMIHRDLVLYFSGVMCKLLMNIKRSPKKNRLSTCSRLFWLHGLNLDDS